MKSSLATLAEQTIGTFAHPIVTIKTNNDEVQEFQPGYNSEDSSDMDGEGEEDEEGFWKKE
jgi:hypothetical protein